MAFEHYIRSGTRYLRCGYTTGTCAALAASGAAWLLLSGSLPQLLRVDTPKGWTVETIPCTWFLSDAAFCAVRKEAGDDPDITNGCLIGARVYQIPHGIRIDGGAGVGRVTKPGLDQPVGAAAINHGPRGMIAGAVADVCAACDYTGGLAVEIIVPDGERLAAKTFNPALGIVGGISILGTSGIVEPMSERAVIDTITLQIRQAARDISGERRLFLTPGNYGLDFLRVRGWDRLRVPVVRCSNFIGDALDTAAAEGFAGVVLVGHIGKLVKLAGGVMNTHSAYADCRMELICAHAALHGADTSLCAALMNAVTTDGAIALLDDAETRPTHAGTGLNHDTTRPEYAETGQRGFRQTVMDSLLDAAQKHLDRRAAGNYTVGAVMFSNVYGYLGCTRKAETLLTRWGAGKSWCIS